VGWGFETCHKGDVFAAVVGVLRCEATTPIEAAVEGAEVVTIIAITVLFAARDDGLTAVVDAAIDRAGISVIAVGRGRAAARLRARFVGATKRADEVAAVHGAGQPIITISVGITAHRIIDGLMNACA
jgi:hypothetical protein